MKLKDVLIEFAADESGATAIEYGLIAAGIALAIIEVIYALGTNLLQSARDRVEIAVRKNGAGRGRAFLSFGRGAIISDTARQPYRRRRVSRP